jgi:hypothetical protein
MADLDLVPSTGDTLSIGRTALPVAKVVTSGALTDTAGNSVTPLQGKTSYDHSQITGYSAHNLGSVADLDAVTTVGTPGTNIYVPTELAVRNAVDAVAGNLTTHAGLTTTAHGGIVASTDARLTDARTPTAHAASHATAGGDAVAPSAIGAEPALGNPASDGMALVSTTAGVRSWADIAAPSGSQHVIIVDPTRGDAADDGDPTTPKLTIQGAMTAIGNAADATAFNAASLRAYIVDIAPGRYTENVSVALRPYVQLSMDGVYITGTVTQDWTGKKALGLGAIATSRFLMESTGLRPGYSGTAPFVRCGVSGAVTINGAFDHGPHILEVNGVTLESTVDFYASATDNWYNQCWYTNTVIIGQTTASGVSGSAMSVSLFARGTALEVHNDKGLGGFSGRVHPYKLENVVITGNISGAANASLEWHWTNVTFLTGVTVDYSAQTSRVFWCDATTYTQLAAIAPGATGNMLTTHCNRLDSPAGVGIGVVLAESASRDLVTADDGHTLICTSNPTFMVKTSLRPDFGVAAKGACTFTAGTSVTVTDVRMTGAIDPWCALVCTGTNTYDVVGGKA